MYIQLTEAAAAFRIQKSDKSDLQLRSIWHKKPKRVEAHILVCFLAYVLWKTLAQLYHRARLGNEPRKVFQELAEVTLVDVLLPTRSGVTIRKRCISPDRAPGDSAPASRSGIAELAGNGPSVVKTEACPYWKYMTYSHNCGRWVRADRR